VAHGWVEFDDLVDDAVAIDFFVFDPVMSMLVSIEQDELDLIIVEDTIDMVGVRNTKEDNALRQWSPMLACVCSLIWQAAQLEVIQGEVIIDVVEDIDGSGIECGDGIDDESNCEKQGQTHGIGIQMTLSDGLTQGEARVIDGTFLLVVEDHSPMLGGVSRLISTDFGSLQTWMHGEATGTGAESVGCACGHRHRRWWATIPCHRGWAWEALRRPRRGHLGSAWW
jgi:hypothetical protein